MATIKIKQGLDAARGGITPAEGELIYATDTQKVFIGDNSTLGGISLNQTATELLIALKTVDGSTSGLDIDTVDGLEGSQLIRNDQDGFLNGTLTIEDETLAAILQTPNANTITDVFLYDTSKDSDGGAWRERTSHTSWYNETLDTATRGSTKEFPAVALIVAETDKVMIYDATDSSYPMWMVFNAGVQYAIGNSTDISCCSMINGILAIGASTNNLWELQFIFDGVFYYNTNTFKRYRPEQYLSKRNTSISINISVDNHYGIINDNVNDVAMTVLDNAPIDTETGLPIPTIAVATDGGVSIIHNDGSVVDITETDTLSYNVWFEDTNIYFSFNYGAWVGYTEIPYYDLNFIRSNINDSDNGVTWIHTTGGSLSISIGNPRILNDNSGESFNSLENDKFGSDLGLTLYEKGDTALNSMVNYITKDYQSGWMQGDIKGAFLSSTNPVNLVETELVINGTFGTDTNWVKGTGWSISSGTATSNGSQTSGSNLTSDTMVFEAGREYRIEVNITSISAGSFQLNVLSDGVANSPVYNSTGLKTWYMKPFFEGSNIQVQADSLFVGSIDNVSVVALDDDRSVNNNGLEINGTVMRSAVATGSELMAYSGFSATNYLEQPYNSDLDFGTGDFYAMGWVKNISVGTSSYMFDREGNSGLERIAMLFNSSGQPWVYIRNTAGNIASIQDTTFGDLSARSDWFFYAFRRYSNGLITFTINDIHSTTNAGLTTNITNVSQTTKFGVSYIPSSPQLGSLSLIRIGAGAPSDEQLKAIYESEGHLFQENAKCTLTSTDSIVNSLSYDEDTNLLHVAGSDNLDTFDDLVRIDSEVGVYTSLSTVNGIVAKGN